MAERLFLDERNLRDAGLNEATIRTFRKLTEFVDTQTQLAAAQQTIVTQGDAIDDANTDIATANAAINVLDGRIDAYDVLAPFVRQDQAAAPSFSGQTITNPPTQAEVQAIDDALAALITALQGIDALT
jgi:hypothetical protein